MEVEKKTSMNKIARALPILFILLAIALSVHYRLDAYLSFASLKTHRAFLLQWTQSHYAQAVVIFMLVYMVAVALSFPGAVFLTLVGGFLFGIWAGTLFVVVSATLGSTLIFFTVQLALSDWLAKKASRWMQKMQQGFQQDAFNYLLILRLVPIFPFWVVNIVAGLLKIPARTFMFGTFVGIIPGSFVYVTVGNSLGHVFDKGTTPNLGIIFEPQVFLPLLGLAALSFIPVIYKKWQRKTR